MEKKQITGEDAQKIISVNNESDESADNNNQESVTITVGEKIYRFCCENLQ